MKIVNKNIFLKLLTKKTLLVVFALVIAIYVPIQMMTKLASATCSSVSECEARINALNQDIANYKAEATRLNAEAQTLRSVLAKLSGEKAVIQSQIDINQAKSDQLAIEIADTEKKINDNKDALGVTIANLYVDDNVTPVEIVFGSQNISDYMDKQEYRNSVRNELVSTIAKIKELKAALEVKRAEVEKILGDQKSARQALADKEAEQQVILDATQGQEAAYQQLSADSQAARQAAIDEYKEMTRPRNPGGSVGISDPSKGNYPWGGDDCYVGTNLYSYNGVNGDGTDPLGYACRQCTSYSAWKVLEYTGNDYRYWGNAKNWPYSAANYGIPVGDYARANSVGVQTGGQYGHVVWVETDPDAEGKIVISQYNSYYDNTGDSNGPGWGNYSKKIVYASEYDRFIYF